MLIQILTHTPYYVWLILAVLVYRGVVAMRDRELKVRQLYIIPVIMVALSLQDIAARFGFALLPVSVWMAGAALMTLMIWQFGASGVAPGAAAGSVRVLGTRVPLAMMMAIFFTKYALAVTLVMQPHYGRNMAFSSVVCALLGIFSGYFLGRLVRDLSSLDRTPNVTAVA